MNEPATPAWRDMSVDERDRLVLSCRPGDPIASALGLADPGWANLDDLGEDALEDARQIAIDFASLVADGAERVVVRDSAPKGVAP